MVFSDIGSFDNSSIPKVKGWFTFNPSSYSRFTNNKRVSNVYSFSYSTISEFNNSIPLLDSSKPILSNPSIDSLFDNGRSSKVLPIFSEPTLDSFNNSIPKLESYKPTLSETSPIVWFNNSTTFSKLYPIVVATPTSCFNNGVALAENDPYRFTTSRYSLISWYNNGSDLNMKYDFVVCCEIEPRLFDNGLSTLITLKHTVFTLTDYSDISLFNNNRVGAYSLQIGEWSLGVFDMPMHIQDLLYPEYNYTSCLADLKWSDLTYNWFNNNVPAVGITQQAKIIPYGYNKSAIQFSLGFPSYTLDLQHKVSNLMTESETELQVYATPPIETEDRIELQYDIDRGEFPLEIQLVGGRELTKRIDTQSYVPPIMLSSIDMQTSIEHPYSEVLDINIDGRLIAEEGLDISSESKELFAHPTLDIQSSTVFYMRDGIDMSVNVEGFIEALALQQSNIVNKNLNLDLCFQMVWHTEYGIDLQHKLHKELFDKVELQVDTPTLTTVTSTDLQVYATPPIDMESRVDLQTTLYFDTDYKIDLQSNVVAFVHDYSLDISWLQKVEADFRVDTQVGVAIPTITKLQSYVIPYGNEWLKCQLSLFPVVNSILDISFDGVPHLDSELEVSVACEVEMTTNLELSMKPEVEMDSRLDLQNSISGITKDNWLDIQYLLDERIDNDIDLQCFTNILLDSQLEISSYNTIHKDYNLSTQIKVSSITTNFGLDLQTDLRSVTTEYGLDLTFDILDLVYYMLYQGYNLVPYWSDGLGSWNTDVEKNWDKEDEQVTMATNLIQQLSDLSLDIEVNEMYDTTTRNFMVYRELLNTPLKNKVLKLLHKDSEKKYLTIGKSKKEKSATVSFKVGSNVFFYDGLEETFNKAVREQIADKIDFTLKYIPQTGKWFKFDDDTDVYFYEDIGGKDLAMPFVFVIVVNEDCDIDIKR